MLDFIYTCRTCTDQRCIDPCAYDSIKYDEVKQEVVINEATCTGCTACAQSCPYGAIDMVEIEPEAPTFKKHFMARLEKKHALQFGSGTPRVARARRIANKCDHCIAYGDQACVSACPTGSLIEINAYDLFRERTPQMAAIGRTGFDVDLKDKDRREVPGDAVHRGSRGARRIAKVKRPPCAAAAVVIDHHIRRGPRRDLAAHRHLGDWGKTDVPGVLVGSRAAR
jgi:Fe-S-cluster-containing hydrogenase component 2